jgi:hypothetical protein
MKTTKIIKIALVATAFFSIALTSNAQWGISSLSNTTQLASPYLSVE